MRRWPGAAPLLGAGLGGLFAAGCGGAVGEAAGASVVVRDAWTRPTAGPNAAVYLTVVNGSDAVVTITGARTEAAASASLHESVVVDAGTHPMAHMAPLAQVGILPGDSAVFAPGGRHLMLERLRAPLRAGGRVGLRLTTTDGGEIAAEAAVRAP